MPSLVGLILRRSRRSRIRPFATLAIETFPICRVNLDNIPRIDGILTIADSKSTAVLI